MLSFPNCKINLGLKVLDERGDGYHNIESVFYPIPFRDVLEVVESNDTIDYYHYSGIPIPGDATENLCVKAVELLRADYEFPKISVHLHKVIAMGAGLGGGSSDASFLIKAIKEKFRLEISNLKMKELALQLGSDCPFFIENVPLGVTGRGELFSPASNALDGFYIVLISSGIHISTAKAYANIMRNESGESPIDIVQTSDIESWKGRLTNDFEGYAFHEFPDLVQAKNHLYLLGAKYASMTGSGSTLYGIFESIPTTTELEKYGQIWTGKL